MCGQAGRTERMLAHRQKHWCFGSIVAEIKTAAVNVRQLQYWQKNIIYIAKPWSLKAKSQTPDY